MSDVTVFNKYAKFQKDKGRRETWEELVTRNMNMHIKKYPFLEAEIRSTYKFVYDKKVLPSMRSLQFGGLPIEMAHNRIYNCAYVPIDHIDAFSELMFLLLGGTGGGYSVQQRHTGQLPIVTGCLQESRRFLVGDSIEGWSDAIKVLVEAHFLGKQKPLFDLRDIREKGAELITTGGKAPGAAPLKLCLDQLEKILVRSKGVQMKPLDVHDMVCTIADAVLAGGIRRAALICLFDRTDEDMLGCKGKFKLEVTRALDVVEDNLCVLTDHNSGRAYLKEIPEYMSTYFEDGVEYLECEWWFIEAQRGRSNNSANLMRGNVLKDDFMDIMQKVRDSGSGEPGVYWTSNLDWGTNPLTT